LSPFASLAATRLNAESGPSNTGEPAVKMQTGNGEWTYEIVPGWGHLPDGTSFGGTHGAIATDNAGHVYISTQSETGVLVYAPDGVLTKKIAAQYPEVHSLVHAQENGQEYFYATVQKGTP